MAESKTRYSGPYDGPVRAGFYEVFHKALETEKIRTEEGSTLRSVMGNEVAEISLLPDMKFR